MSDAELLAIQPKLDPERAKAFRELTSEDGFVLSMVDGERTVDQIRTECPLQDDRVLACVRKLLDLGVLSAPGQWTPKAEEKPAASPPAVPPAAQAAPQEAPEAAAREPDASTGARADAAATGAGRARPPEWVLRALRGEPGGEAPPEEREALDARRDDPPLAVPVDDEPADDGPAAVERTAVERTGGGGQADPPPAPGAPPPPRESDREAAAARTSSAAPPGEVLKPWRVEGKPSGGDLKETPIFKLLRELHDGRKSGLLRLELAGDDWREVYFWRGDPQYIVEADPKHRFGDALVRSGLVRPDDLDRALEVAGRENRMLGLALAQLGSLTEFQIKGITRTLVEMRLADFFELERGEYTFTEDDRERNDLVLGEADMDRILFHGLKTKFPWNQARDELEGEQDLYLVRNPEMEEKLTGIKLTPKEQRFVRDVIDGTKTLRQVLGYSTLKASETFRFVHALVRTGFLEFKKDPLATARQSQLADELEHKRRSQRGVSHFDALDLHWTCLQREVDGRYETLKREFGPDRKGIRDDPELLKMSEEIMAVVEAAYAVLGAPGSRRRYRAELIPRDKVRFALQFNQQQAKDYRFMGDVDATQECIDRIKELDPDARIEVE